MVFKQIIEMYDILDNSEVNGLLIQDLFYQRGFKNIEIKKVKGTKNSTEFIKIVIPGENGRITGGNSPTLGIIGQLGGIGAFPIVTGFVSDGDGALVALASALKLVEMLKKGDKLAGDIIITTHICPRATIKPRKPVNFMDLPMPIDTINKFLVDSAMDSILSIDTSKGNKLVNQRGFAITPTVKEGYILKVSDQLVEIMERVTGVFPVVFPITTQDITTYNNGIYHINSIMQPATCTDAPVVGVPITAQTLVAGDSTGASNLMDLEMAARFCIEVAKDYGSGKCTFYDEEEFKKIVSLYGSMKHLLSCC